MKCARCSRDAQERSGDMIGVFLFALTLFSSVQDGLEVALSSQSAQIDPGKSVFVDLSIVTPADVEPIAPDLRTRVRGFSLAEDFVREPYIREDGRRVLEVRWRLLPEVCAKKYKIAPFAISTKSGKSYLAGPVYFENPPPREKVSGDMEVNPEKDLPPLSWKLVFTCVIWLLVLCAVAGLVFWCVRTISRKVKEHRMSPVERAWAELDRLIKKGLPGRGRYKDFYIELTMVVRRYVQRKHGVRAPNRTTEEFFKEVCALPSFPKEALDGLMEFLSRADMVKFAGVKANPEMADDATESAKAYIRADDHTRSGGAK